MLPHEAAQLTVAFALNCCVRPALVAALAGVITRGEVTVTAVDAILPVADLAVTVQEVTINGAVNRPLEFMVPQEEVYVGVPVVLNCTVPPAVTVGFSGEIANWVGAETISYPYTV